MIEENVIQIQSGITIKNIMYVKKIIFRILLATCSCENGKYLASIIDDSVITCEEIIEETKTVPTSFNEKKQSVKYKISIFYLHFFNYYSIINRC